MANTITLLLTPEERYALYEPPVFDDAERNEFFTFSDAEIIALNSFQHIEASVYFAISLAFFKVKYTLVKFNYRDVTNERQHVMQRYFPRKANPRSFPHETDRIVQIENKVLDIVGFVRFRGEVADKMLLLLQKQAAFYPRQRQLCKAFLNQLIKEKVAIPTMTRVQDCISTVWNTELARIIKAYRRYTTKQNRQAILALLTKTDDKHRIISIKKDMKQFTTSDIRTESEKHESLEKIFLIAKNVLPKLQLPTATIHYYAELINYYNGARLKELNAEVIQLYLLCYSFSRFQIINDNLLEAFKKRTLTYSSDSKKTADQEAAKYVNEIKAIRQKVHDLLITIKEDKNKETMPKSKLFHCIPETELLTTAHALLNDKLDKTLLYWQCIDQNAASIVINLRPLFLRLDITILRDDLLKRVVTYMKANVAGAHSQELPKEIHDCIPPDLLPYLKTNGTFHAIRLEFFFYKQLGASH